MSDPKNKKPRRALKNLPPDRFQPKMLIFWLALVAAVLALLYLTPNMTTSPEALTIQDVVERSESHNIKSGGIIQPDPSGGPGWVIIRGDSRKDDTPASGFQPFRAAGPLTHVSLMELQQSKLFVEQPSQTLLTSIAASVIPLVVIIGLLYFILVC